MMVKKLIVPALLGVLCVPVYAGFYESGEEPSMEEIKEIAKSKIDIRQTFHENCLEGNDPNICVEYARGFADGLEEDYHIAISYEIDHRASVSIVDYMKKALENGYTAYGDNDANHQVCHQTALEMIREHYKSFADIAEIQASAQVCASAAYWDSRPITDFIL